MATVMTAEEAKYAILQGEAPAGLTVAGWLSFDPTNYYEQNTTFTWLPDNLTVDQLSIRRCANFRLWPKGLRCKTLTVEECPVASFPDDLLVSDSLDLRSCHNITSIPNNLAVRGNVYLDSCSKLETIPDGMGFGRSSSLSAHV